MRLYRGLLRDRLYHEERESPVSQDHLVEFVRYWKERCAKAEKEVKGFSETSDSLRDNLKNRERDVEYWKERAIEAERNLREFNE